LVGLIRFGLWKLISGERFTPLRRRLLYNPGIGASHEIVMQAAGVDENDHAETVCATVADPEGQTHVTAVGALVQPQRLLGRHATAHRICLPDLTLLVDARDSRVYNASTIGGPS
jgi:hypothetical protein